jgi:hypothetical protein
LLLLLLLLLLLQLWLWVYWSGSEVCEWVREVVARKAASVGRHLGCCCASMGQSHAPWSVVLDA